MTPREAPKVLIRGSYLAELECEHGVRHTEGLLVRKAKSFCSLRKGGVLDELEIPELDFVIGRNGYQSTLIRSGQELYVSARKASKLSNGEVVT